MLHHPLRRAFALAILLIAAQLSPAQTPKTVQLQDLTWTAAGRSLVNAYREIIGRQATRDRTSSPSAKQVPRH